MSEDDTDQLLVWRKSNSDWMDVKKKQFQMGAIPVNKERWGRPCASPEAGSEGPGRGQGVEGSRQGQGPPHTSSQR